MYKKRSIKAKEYTNIIKRSIQKITIFTIAFISIQEYKHDNERLFKKELYKKFNAFT